ncbi:MAG TPA: undecaprenyl-diphosphatase UppP [Candidatus Lambdaproteobacteria bacterium]|nr:undecaprenyl-diphosphatase UppP [Candidatus Lambdaproteobacteria bacterium]HIO10968.1 undecaprenyl-diphosphatase UppP [Deltaproteobacteria bacterium]
MDWIQALVLGVVQGLSEFLPISSTAHLRIVPHLLNWQDPGTEFSAVIQLGTLVAVMLYFRQDVWQLSYAAIESLLKRKPLSTPESRMAWSIAAGTIPVVAFGLGFKDFIKNEARELWVIGTALIVLAIFLYLAEKLSPRNRDIKQLSFLQIQFIGLTQALALIPGCSRSGSTIMGGLIVGLNREAAARFSFLLGLPAIFGSCLYELKELVELGISSDGYFNLAVGIAAAFVTGYLSIELLLRFLRNHGTLVFVIYRIVLGTGILLFLV